MVVEISMGGWDLAGGEYCHGEQIVAMTGGRATIRVRTFQRKTVADRWSRKAIGEIKAVRRATTLVMKIKTDAIL